MAEGALFGSLELPKSALDHHLVHVAPAPVLARLERPDDRVAGGVKVLGSVLVSRLVAATYIPAGQALAQVNPGIARLQALYTTLATRLHVLDLVGVRTLRGKTSVHRFSPL